MADIKAQASTNWSLTSTWAGGVLPGPGDDVYANNFAVVINQDITCASLRNTAGTGITAGGSFNTDTTARTITANVIAGAVACLTINNASGAAVINGNISSVGLGRGVQHASTGGSLTVNGNVGGSTTGASGFGLSCQATNSACNVNGNVTGGGAANAHGVSVTTTGTAPVTVTGNVLGGTAGSAYGIIVSTVNNVLVVVGTVTGGPGATGIQIGNSGQTVTITGNCYGSATGAFYAFVNANTATVTVNGSVTGGDASGALGCNNGSTGIVNINGIVIGGKGSGAVGFRNDGGSLTNVYVQCARGNNWPNDSLANQNVGIVQNGAGGAINVDAMEFGSGGTPAISSSGRYFMRGAGTNYLLMYQSNGGSTITIGEISADYPAAANVRNGTIYNFGSNTGTLKVPAVGSVALGVEVDNTTGVAILTTAAIAGALSIPTVAQIVAGVDPVVPSVGEIVAGVSTIIPTPQSIANAVGPVIQANAP